MSLYLRWGDVQSVWCQQITETSMDSNSVSSQNANEETTNTPHFPTNVVPKVLSLPLSMEEERGPGNEVANLVPRAFSALLFQDGGNGGAWL